MRRLSDLWQVVQSYPGAARQPTPAVSWTIFPRTIMIGRPAPGIRRYPGIPRARIPCPGSVRERIPIRAGKERPPQRAACRAIDNASVIIHVAYAGDIGKVHIGGAVCIVLVVINRILVPSVILSLEHILGQDGFTLFC